MNEVKPVVNDKTFGLKPKPKDNWKTPHQPNEMDKFKQYDILTLKKLVIEEIKNELELQGYGK